MLCVMLVFLPFAAGIADYLIAKRSGRGRDGFAVTFSFLELLLSVLLVMAVRGGGGFVITGMQKVQGYDSVFRLTIGGVFDSGLSFQMDGFRCVYSLVTSLMWSFTTLFSLEYFAHEREHLSRYYLFVLFTLGATQGVMLSADLMTTFVFFEILSLTSFTWVMHEETAGALRAGYTYLTIAVVGGLILFLGLAILKHAAGTLSYSELFAAVKASDAGEGEILAAGILILIGFGCKAGMFPVHVWLPKAHPVAPSPASALLSGVLTKVGIYGILMTALEVLIDSAPFGWIILILGTVTMFLGAVLALFSINLKRTLACSSMSQIGFILTGIAMTILLHVQHLSTHTEMTVQEIVSASGQAAGETAHAAGAGFAALEHHTVMSMSGTLLHMVNHSMLKLCLFCAAGVVVMNLHELDLNVIRGWGRKKPALMAAFFLGVIGIGGVPLFNGYASKTLLHEAITTGMMEAKNGAAGVLSVIEWIFLISGGCTFAYMLKLFICVFVEKNSDPARQKRYDQNPKGYMHAGGYIAVCGTSLLFIALGQKPVFNHLASFMTGHEDALGEFAPLSFECVKGAMISLGIGTLLYVVFIRRVLMKKGAYVNLWPEWLDLEELLYRPLLMKRLPGFLGSLFRIPAENRVLSVVCRILLTVSSAFMRYLALSTDVLVVFVKKKVLPEHVVTGREQKTGILERRRIALKEAYEPITGNFSFTLMLSCIGMMVIIGVILYFNLRAG